MITDVLIYFIAISGLVVVLIPLLLKDDEPPPRKLFEFDQPPPRKPFEWKNAPEKPKVMQCRGCGAGLTGNRICIWCKTDNT